MTQRTPTLEPHSGILADTSTDPGFTVVRHLHIFGQVQGVGFRYHFSEQARRLGIAGWVRNRRSGSVEAMIEGTPEAVEALLAWARLGPPAARVERVEVSAAEGAFAGFELRPTQ